MEERIHSWLYVRYWDLVDVQACRGPVIIEVKDDLA